MAEMTLIEAIRQGLDEELGRDERVFITGEDVGKRGGVFRATQGLQAKYGKSRCFDAPISELGIVGTAVGMARVGPWVLAPGFGSKVSNWLGPPAIQRRMQALRALRSSSACRVR